MVYVQRDRQILFQVFCMADVVCGVVVMDTWVVLVLCSSVVWPFNFGTYLWGRESSPKCIRLFSRKAQMSTKFQLPILLPTQLDTRKYPKFFNMVSFLIQLSCLLKLLIYYSRGLVPCEHYNWQLKTWYGWECGGKNPALGLKTLWVFRGNFFRKPHVFVLDHFVTIMANYFLGLNVYCLLIYVCIYVFKWFWVFCTTRDMMWFCQILVWQKLTCGCLPLYVD